MQNSAPILLAESDANDVELLRRAFKKAGITSPLTVVRDGQQAIDYLAGQGRYHNRHEHPWPCLMLLALKLLRVDGTQVLEWWKENRHDNQLPIIVLTSSASPAKLRELMAFGAADYRFKPGDFDELVTMVQELRYAWLERAQREAC